MGLSQQLSAMVFELRGAGSPVAKAKALARAWRFVRRLSPSDRKVLAHEAGFDGAEDLLENLATKRGGMAPAMMLQLLGGLRDRGDEGLGLLMACLKDPETRDEILMRGVDAIAEVVGPVEDEDEEILDELLDSCDAIAAEPESLVTPPPNEHEKTPVSEPDSTGTLTGNATLSTLADDALVDNAGETAILTTAPAETTGHQKGQGESDQVRCTS